MKQNNLVLFTIAMAALAILAVIISFYPHYLTSAYSDQASEKDKLIIELQQTNNKLEKKYAQLASTAQSEESVDSLLNITQLDLMEDILTTYPHLSDQQKRIIIDTIFEESSNYNINPLIIYSLIHAESSFRFWIEHAQVTINGKKMRAVGLGGIMWYWWGETLSEAKIASTRSELFDPVTNIKAIVYIYHHLTTVNMHKDASNIHHSAMLRYFGGSYSHYIKSIEDKMMSIIAKKLYQKDQ